MIILQVAHHKKKPREQTYVLWLDTNRHHQVKQVLYPQKV